MVCFNDKLPINLDQMNREIIKKLDKIIEDQLYYLDDKIISEDKKIRLKNQIIKEMKDKIKSDNFIYLIMDDNYCTYKYKRGKNERNYCSKKIRTNLEGQKKDYLCCKHSKKHIPEKRKEKINETKYDLVSPGVNDIKNNIKLKLDPDENKNEIVSREVCHMMTPNISKIKNNNNVLSLKSKIIKQNVKIKEIENNSKDRTNIYKECVINKNYIYETLKKEYSLLDFCINKIKNKYKPIYNSIYF